VRNTLLYLHSMLIYLSSLRWMLASDSYVCWVYESCI